MTHGQKTHSNPLDFVSDEEIDSELPRFNPYAAMIIIIIVQLAYYSLWIWALNQ